MTTLQEKIDALPPMPQPLLNPNYPGETVRQFREQYWVDVARAALARLAMAREWVENHYCTTDCGKWEPDTLNERLKINSGDCTCGRDALLAALEVPK